MKIVHVVTYMSPDGAFGGPTRVATGQAEALAARGHHVTVYAAAPSGLEGERAMDGFMVRTYPGRRLASRGGFASMWSPKLTSALRRDLRDADVAHVHFARDLIAIPAALAIRRSRVRYVLQPHGMVDESNRFLAHLLDFFVTRSILRGAERVLTLTDQEDSDLSAIEPGARTERLPNGVKLVQMPPYEGRALTVVFLARLHARKRPLAFVKMAELLAPDFPGVQFILHGPDEGEGDAVRAAIERSPQSAAIEWRGAVSPDATKAALSNALVYVLPAENEVFPMTILESLQAGTPVVTTDSLGIAQDCKQYGAAEITDGSPAELAAAVRRILLDRSKVENLRRGGERYLRVKLNIDEVAYRLEGIYSSDPSGYSVSSGN